MQSQSNAEESNAEESNAEACWVNSQPLWETRVMLKGYGGIPLEIFPEIPDFKLL